MTKYPNYYNTYRDQPVLLQQVPYPYALYLKRLKYERMRHGGLNTPALNKAPN